MSGRKGFTNINCSGREGDELKDVAHSRWKVLQCVERDDHPAIERGGEPEVEGVVGYAGKRDEPASDNGEVTPWSAEVAAYYFVFAPHSGDDFWCEGVRAKQ